MHFNSPSHTVQDTKVIVVEQIKKNDSWMKRTKESHHPGTPFTLVRGTLIPDPELPPLNYELSMNISRALIVCFCIPEEGHRPKCILYTFCWLKIIILAPNVMQCIPFMTRETKRLSMLTGVDWNTHKVLMLTFFWLILKLTSLILVLFIFDSSWRETLLPNILVPIRASSSGGPLMMMAWKYSLVLKCPFSHKVRTC